MESFTPHPEGTSWFAIRVRSFRSAFRGLGLFSATTPHSWIHALIFLATLALGIYVNLSRTEYVIIILTGGLVLVTEALNTAFEIDINLTSPEYHPHARDTKDVAAGAVLLASLIAIAVGVIIFYPHVSVLVWK